MTKEETEEIAQLVNEVILENLRASKRAAKRSIEALTAVDSKSYAEASETHAVAAYRASELICVRR